MDHLKAGLNPYFAIEVNLKDPTNFQTLLQVCQIYDRQLRVLRMGADTTMAITGANVVRTLNAPHLSSIVHGGRVFPNIFNSNITNQASIPMMRDVDNLRTDGTSPEQLSQCLDELMNKFHQMQASFNTNQVQLVPQEKRVPVCYQIQGGSISHNNHANNNNQASMDGGP